jgi:hypothetical protein
MASIALINNYPLYVSSYIAINAPMITGSEQVNKEINERMLNPVNY